MQEHQAHAKMTGIGYPICAGCLLFVFKLTVPDFSIPKMDDVKSFKLIQAVDPTNIKVTVNDKLSKLTLSSNKKKKKTADSNPTNDEIYLEKKKSASRNLMDDLNENDDEQNKNKNPNLYVNAILRSKSLSSEDKELIHTETLSQIYDVKTEDCSALSMECLQISDDDEELEDLTQKISNISVRKRRDISLKASQLSSTIIDISSSEEEESVIYVSDSSIDDSSKVKDPYNDYNFMVVSNVQNSAETNPSLPSTLSNERADRIEAFLHDVSQEQRYIQASGGLPEDSLFLHLRPSIEDDGPKSANALFESVKAKMIATADTESMSPVETESNSKVKETNQRNLALDDTEIMGESMQESFLPEKSIMTRNSNDGPKRADDSFAKRIANDDTELNTTINTLEDTVQSDLNISEVDVTIPETSSEDINCSNISSNKKQEKIVPSEEALSSSPGSDTAERSQVQLSVGSVNISAKINIKLQINTQFMTSSEDSEESDENNTTDGNSSPDDNEIKATNENEEEEKKDYCKGRKSKEVESVRAKDELSKVISNIQNQNVGVPSETNSSNKNNGVELVEIEDDGENFMTHAQKLLTNLYGNSWQTPEVIRTLRRTSSETKVKNKLSTACKELDSIKKEKPLEESAVDDFSIFRQNIVQTNMDSTRMTTPKPRPKIKEKVLSNNVFTEPKPPPKKVTNLKNKTPQTELKKNSTKIASRSVRAMNERWRQLIDDDSDSDHNNMTDDADIDQTVISDDNDDVMSNASDSSWQKSTEELSSDEDDQKIRKRNTKKTKSQRKGIKATKSSKDRLIYLDLSKNEVTILNDTPTNSPPANKDENFEKHLSEILRSCRYEDKAKMVPNPTSTGKSKRRLFTVSYNDEIEDESITAICRGETPKKDDAGLIEEHVENVKFNGVAIPPSFNVFNKPLEAIKTGKPVFKITPTRGRMPGTPIAPREEVTPFKNHEKYIYQTPTKNKHKLDEISSTPSFKYGFLKSLDVCVGKALCHPDALIFRENYRQKKEDLAEILYELYNSKLFANKLNVPLIWNKKLSNTAGRCLNKKKLGQRLSVVELSDKVLTSADRLRCTLIHELCHAATWIFDGEGGHGAKWKEWARKANTVFPDLPKIGVCHQYDIEYKYTYKCTLCAAKSYYHSKSKKVENIRCSYCYGVIEIFLNKKDKEGNIIPTPVREPTGFAKFVKDKYQQYKRPDMKHADVMKLLSSEFATLKVAGNVK